MRTHLVSIADGKRKSALLPGVACTVTLHEGGGSVRYEALQLVGRGANSETFLARDESGQLCVLKAALPKAEAVEDSDLVIAQRILEQLSHENLVRYLGSGRTQGGRLVLAFERACPNPSLLLNEGSAREHFPHPGTRYYPLPTRIALTLALDVLRGLEYMHSQGFVHHDVKPANVMLRVPRKEPRVPTHHILGDLYEGQARGVLIDIGGSRSKAYLEDLNRGVVDPSVVPPQLTPLYAPPEALVAGSGRELLPSLDLYAAALVAYTLATGRGPYDHLVEEDQWGTLQGLKREEAEGKLSPIELEALQSAHGMADMAAPLYDFLRACTDRRTEKRPSVSAARQHLEELVAWRDSAPTQVKGGSESNPVSRGPPPELDWFFSGKPSEPLS